MKVALLSLIVLAWPVWAESPGQQKAVMDKVGFAQNLNAQIPLDLPFTNEAGQPVHLRDYFGSKPVILSLVYFQCPMLCTETLNGLVRAIRPIHFDLGNQYSMVTVSFDPNEKTALAAAKKRLYVDRYGRKNAGRGWAFLTGTADSIKKLTDAVGFHFAWDRELGQFAHGTGIMVLTPAGRISHYFYGVEYSPRDLRLALLEASAGKIGSPVDALLLYCYHYDPTTGKYGLLIYRVIRLAGLLTVAIIAILLVFLFRQERSALRG